MGNVSGTGSASRTRSDTNTNSETQSQGTSDPTFNSPQSQQILASLTGTSTNPGTQQQENQAGSTLTGAAQTGSALPNYTTNPYVTALIDANNKLGQTTFQQGEAGIRAQGYRGGDNSNANMQGNYAANFANQQAAQDASTQLGQYNTANQTALSAASGLGSLSQGQQGLAAQILAMLRGTATTGQSITNADTSGTTSGTSQSISAKYGF